MKSKIIILVAAVAILIGLYGVVGSLPSSNVVDTPLIAEDKYKVWRVNQNVIKGQLVERSQFSIEMMPESQAHGIGIADDIDIEFEPGAVYKNDHDAQSVAFPEWIIQPNDDGYVELVIQPQRVPYAISVDPKSVVGGVISNGSTVDILALSTPGTTASIEVGSGQSTRSRTISITPILIAVKVLQVKKTLVEETRTSAAATEVDLILELTRKQVAKLTVAKRISELEVHKSIGEYKASDLQADAGDVLADFKSITEFRASEAQIN